jgi:hypothetical protein
MTKTRGDYLPMVTGTTDNGGYSFSSVIKSSNPIEATFVISSQAKEGISSNARDGGTAFIERGVEMDSEGV